MGWGGGGDEGGAERRGGGGGGENSKTAGESVLNVKIRKQELGRSLPKSSISLWAEKPAARPAATLGSRKTTITDNNNKKLNLDVIGLGVKVVQIFIMPLQIDDFVEDPGF